MSTKARITTDYKFKITGNVTRGENGFSLRTTGDLICWDTYTSLDAFDEESEIDEDEDVDLDEEIDDEEGIERFFADFLSIGTIGVSPERVEIEPSGRVIANDFEEEQDLE